MPRGRKRPAPFPAFSPFSRSLIFSAAAAAVPKPLIPSPDYATQCIPCSPGNMPRPPSKRAKRAEPSSDEERISSESEEESFSASDSDGDDGEESSEELETVQADFAFFDPKPSDFHGVRLLLKTYLDSKPWDLTGFVDLILAQTTVGTVVKLADDDGEEGEGNGGDKTNAGGNDDDDLFGLISVLNLGRYAEHRCVKDLKEYLLAACSDKDSKKQLKSLLEEKASSVGLLVCRRFVNFPYELVPKLYDSLFDEVSWATEDEPTQELRDSFRFKHYLLLVRMLERKTPAKHKAKNSKDDDEPIIYPKLEDEIFNELSSWSFTFPIHSEQSSQQEMKNYKEMGLVMAVKAEAIPKFRKKLEALVCE
ncbi:protein BCCIP homolog [Setaria italica]|nr:protein BCCIP homolog [Setaria italica]